MFSEKNDKKIFSEKEIQGEILATLLAGYDTTSILLTLSIVWLFLNPEIYEKAKKEALSQQWIIEKRYPTLQEIYETNFIDNIIKETLRTSSPGWLTPRQAKNDVWIDEVFIPKGSHVFVSQYVSHRNPDYFSNPFTWNPERWNNNFEKKLPKGVFYPFGGGARKCIGEHLAWTEAKIFITMMLSKTKWKSMSKKRVFPKIKYHITAAPSEKVVFSFEPLVL